MSTTVGPRKLHPRLPVSIRSNSPLLQVPLADPPEPKGANCSHTEENGGASRTTSREVSLVLDRFEAAAWGEISVGKRGVNGVRAELVQEVRTACKEPS